MIKNLVKGRVWVLRDTSGKPLDNIDTEKIFPETYLNVTDISDMGQYTFNNLRGWEDFPDTSKKGDIIICGRNFGTGAPRQHAVDCFRSLGISLIISESFDPVYKRHAINSGFPVLVCPDICSQKSNNVFLVQQGDVLVINGETGEMNNKTRNLPISGCIPFSRVQLDILQAGNLFNYGRTQPEQD